MVLWIALIVLGTSMHFSEPQTASSGAHQPLNTCLPTDVATDYLIVHKTRKIMILQYSDSGHTIVLKLNKEIQIDLAENPTTGYQWQIVEDGTPALEKSGDSFQRGSSPGLGAGGTRSFLFRSRFAGTAKLRIVYGRPGVKDSIKQEFLLNVRVSDD